MGFKRMQRLTHDMENVFQEVRSNNMSVTSGLVDVLFQCLDAIDAYLENVKESSEEGTDDNEAIIQELNDILAAGTGNAPAKEEKPAVKEEPAQNEGEDRFQKKYLDIEFSEKEKEELRVSEEKGMKLYGIPAPWLLRLPLLPSLPLQRSALYIQPFLPLLLQFQKQLWKLPESYPAPFRLQSKN